MSSSTVYCVLLTMSAETRFMSGVLVVPVDRDTGGSNCVLLTMSAETRFMSGVLVVPVDRDTVWESLPSRKVV